MATQTQLKIQSKTIQIKKIQIKRLAAIAVVTLGYLAVVPLMASEMASEAGRDGVAAAFGYRDRGPDAETQTQTQNQIQNQTAPPCDRRAPDRGPVQLAARSRGDGPWQAVVVLRSADCAPRKGV
jgi:hypothetical protein